jgi:hypothetical protein
MEINVIKLPAKTSNPQLERFREPTGEIMFTWGSRTDGHQPFGCILRHVQRPLQSYCITTGPIFTIEYKQVTFRGIYVLPHTCSTAWRLSPRPKSPADIQPGS